jgi:ParB family transcriptional regulator, chromosome partitioning protein
MAKKKTLGKNLSALLGPEFKATPDTVPAAGDVNEVPLSVCRAGQAQPRQDMDPAALQELADSIKVHGVIQPIIVRKHAADDYEIIAGERRFRAAHLAGLKKIPAIVRDYSDEVANAVALIENIQREDLNPLDQAQAIERLIQEYQYTHQQIAEQLGKSRASISNCLRLLSLPTDVKRLLSHGDLEMGHARALLSLSGQQQILAARKVVADGLSVRETEHLVRQLNQAPKQAPVAPTKRAEPKWFSQLKTQLPLPITMQAKTIHSGKLVISYRNEAELERLRALLSDTAEV